MKEDWRDTTEISPSYDVPVLGFYYDPRSVSTIRFTREGWQRGHSGLPTRAPDYWMPMPMGPDIKIQESKPQPLIEWFPMSGEGAKWPEHDHFVIVITRTFAVIGGIKVERKKHDTAVISIDGKPQGEIFEFETLEFKGINISEVAYWTYESKVSREDA